MMIMIITILNTNNHNPEINLPLSPKEHDRAIVQNYTNGRIAERHIYQAVRQNDKVIWQEISCP